MGHMQLRAAWASPASANPAVLAGGLSVETTVKRRECGRRSASGDRLSMHYVGKLQDGSTFDSSRGRGPFDFTLGRGEVIMGWDRGLEGMCAGESRVLTIPAALAYGERGAGGVIPPGATLTFDVELLAIR